MPDLESQTVNVGKLFSQEYFFRIPDYQRPFSWDVDNLTDLIDDLVDAPKTTDYFLGTLVLHAVSNEPNTYDVVDGQQRLTALCILLACMRDSDALRDDLNTRTQIQNMLMQQAQSLAGIPERNRLHVWDVSVFNKVVIEAGGTKNSGVIDQSIGRGEQRYRTAVELFHKKLATLSLAVFIELAEFVVQRCVVIYLAAKSFEDAFRLFTVINDRGKQLRRIDVLKANNLAPNVIADNAVRTQYAKKWEALEEQLGASNFEEIFSSLRLIYVQEKPQGDLLKEFNERILGKPNKPSLGTDFIDRLAEYVDLYDALFVEQDYLEGTLYAAKFESLMSAMVSEFAASEWRACVLLFAKRFGKAEIYQFLLNIEKIFLEQWVGGVRKDERYSTYTTMLKLIDISKKSKDVLTVMAFSLSKIQDACRLPNFYSAGYAKYLLLRAELLAAELTEPRKFNVRSVEHVLPQAPATGSQWRKDFTDDELEELVHSAGNLVLLSKAKNSAAGNREFAQKKTTYLKPRVTDFPRSVEVLNEDAWSPQLIRDRTDTFARSVLADI